MSDVKTRKAVVTTAQVQAAVDQYRKVQAELGGVEVPALEFDKGSRGMKPFAVYNGNTPVREFDTKDEALSFYTTWVAVAGEVLTMQAAKAAETPIKAPRNVAAKVVEGSQEGDAPKA